MAREIVVLPHLRVRGWDGGEVDDLKMYQRVSWEAFCSEQKTDAMAVGYLVPGEDKQPRLNRAALDALRAHGQEPELHWAFFDLDRPNHEPWADPTQATVSLYTLLPSLPPGAGGYTTRAGLRVVWPLDPPLPASLAQSFLRPMTELIGENTELEVDPASVEWTRLFRTPRANRDGTTLPSVVQEPTTPLNPYEFSKEKGWTLSSDNQGSATFDDADLPDAPVDLSFDQWKAAWAHPYLKVGSPIPEEGGHHYPVLRRILSSIARAGITDPLVLLSYVWDSVQNTPGLELAETWRLCLWFAAQEEHKTKPETTDPDVPPQQVTRPTREEWAAIRPYFRGRDRTLFERLADGVKLSNQNDRLAEITFHAIRVLAEKAGVNDANEIYRFVHASMEAAAPKGPLPTAVWKRALEAVDVAALGDDNEAARILFIQEHPLTIKQVGKGGGLFQLDTTVSPYRYRPTDSQSIYLHFDRLTQPNLPFEAEYPSAMPLQQILRTYGRTVDRVVYTSGQDGTIYSRAGNDISQGVHTVEARTAKFHEDIAGLLELLGGDNPDLLLDWLAALTYTSTEPTAALYIEGPPGCGKSLLAIACASVFGSAPTDYNKVQGGFNGALLANPLLLADEGITVDNYSEASAAEQFRSYVANTTHAINAKFAAPAELHGALRVVITANDEHGLPFKKALGKDGIEAITSRVLYLKADPQARAYLTKLGGRRGIRDWISSNSQPGRFAEHILWLRDNRQLESGRRFLVEGRPTAWHRTFAASQGYKPAVLAVTAGIAKALETTPLPNIYVRCDTQAKVLWVHHGSIYDLWAKYADVRRPKPAQVGETVRMLAGGPSKQIRFDKRKWCYPIPFQAFVDAQVLEWGDLGFEEGSNADTD